MTNIEKVAHVMTYSKYGALSQMFVMDALHQWSRIISNAPPERLDNGFVHAEAWIAVATEIQEALRSELTINDSECDETIGRPTSTVPLPPDIDSKNEDRAEWAKVSIQAFMDCTGVDREDALGDLLCDLMHLSDREPFDFEAALDRARGHYAAETGNAPY
jgi:hypothetical protein